jgi:hypothetical protein
MEPLIIRKAATNLYVLLALSVLSLLVFSDIFLFHGHVTLVTILTFAVFSILSVSLFIYALRELIKKTPQITFTQEGLVIKDSSFYAWENLDAFTFSIEEVGSDNAGRIYKKYITAALKDGASAKIAISHLDRNADEIMYLLESYKRRADDIRAPFKQ